MTTTTVTTTTVAAGHDIRHAAERLELLDEHRLRVGDHVETADPATMIRAAESAVYWRHYLGVEPSVGDRRLPMAREDRAYTARLQHADGGRAVWDAGWRVERSGADRVVLASAADGVHICATRDEIRHHAGGVLVRFPTERRHASPGFYMTTGLAGPAPHHPLRWYLNASAADMPSLLAGLVGGLDSAEVAFTVKTLNDPTAEPRPDATVLYGAREEARTFATIIAGATRGVRLRAAVPAFTRRLRAGVAVADEPSWAVTPVSFGQHRSRLVVTGLMAAGVGSTRADRARAISEAFLAEGLDPTRPHLAPGTLEIDLGTPWT